MRNSHVFFAITLKREKATIAGTDFIFSVDSISHAIGIPNHDNFKKEKHNGGLLETFRQDKTFVMLNAFYFWLGMKLI